jgi:hypothetical protein
MQDVAVWRGQKRWIGEVAVVGKGVSIGLERCGCRREEISQASFRYSAQVLSVKNKIHKINEN